MDIKKAQNSLLQFIKKYRYVILVLVIGFVLMAIPEDNEESESTVDVLPVQTQNDIAINEQLANVLSKIRGAGKVQVLLTVATGEEVIYQTNDDISSGGGTESTKTDTVTITDSARNQSGLVRQVNPPAYMGAIVVCEGADNPSVQLAITEAVSKVTGLGSNRISVLKMK